MIYLFFFLGICINLKTHGDRGEREKDNECRREWCYEFCVIR